MADVKQCDRCGGYYIEGKHHFMKVCGEWRVKEYDLCHSCFNELEEFMRGTKPRNLLDRIRRMMRKED